MLFYLQRAINWASAYDPLDTKLKTTMDYTPTLSAGNIRVIKHNKKTINSLTFFITILSLHANPLSRSENYKRMCLNK